MSAAIFFFGNLVFIIFGKGSIQRWNNIKNADDNVQKSRMCKFFVLFACCILSRFQIEFLYKLQTNKSLKRNTLNSKILKFLDYGPSNRSTGELLELLEVDDLDSED